MLRVCFLLLLIFSFPTYDVALFSPIRAHSRRQLRRMFHYRRERKTASREEESHPVRSLRIRGGEKRGRTVLLPAGIEGGHAPSPPGGGTGARCRRAADPEHFQRRPFSAHKDQQRLGWVGVGWWVGQGWGKGVWWLGSSSIRSTFA